MTSKPMQTETFTATHENGTEWRLAVNSKRGSDFADSQAKLFARNYCMKKRIHGSVTLVSDADGRTIVADICDKYTVNYQ